MGVGRMSGCARCGFVGMSRVFVKMFVLESVAMECDACSANRGPFAQNVLGKPPRNMLREM